MLVAWLLQTPVLDEMSFRIRSLLEASERGGRIELQGPHIAELGRALAWKQQGGAHGVGAGLALLADQVLPVSGAAVEGQ